MNAIAIVDENWGLGKDGKLLIHLPGDLKYFKEKTLGKTIIIGRKTFDSLGKRLLPDRETVIVSQNMKYDPGCMVCRSLEEALRYVKGRRPDDVFVAGGEAIYNLFLPYCDTFFITKIQASFEADKYFPNLDSSNRFYIDKSSAVVEENGVKYRFYKYTRE